MASATEFFQQNNYVVIRDFLSPELASYLYDYCSLTATAGKTKLQHGLQPSSISEGTFSDPQVPGTYSAYGDPAFDVLLETRRAVIEEISGHQLLPTYTFWRYYKHGDTLARHIDRISAEISATVCLGYNTGDFELEDDYRWGIWFQDKQGGEPKEMKLTPGSMIVYRGYDLLHWREQFEGLHHAQVFFHYVDRLGKFADLAQCDTRPHLGLPQELKDPRKTQAIDQLEASVV